jgi:hypothetical protein
VGSREFERLGFLIVGTPRSGTTLVQRLASELSGVRVPPETHFFSVFWPHLARRRTFPLDGESLKEEVQCFLNLETSRGMDLVVADVVDAMGGRCTSALEFFVEIVFQLAGEGRVVGEKTPSHLLWWRPLTRALPHLRVITVVRDPRGVANSYSAAPFGMDSPVVLAESWVSDQRIVLSASRELGEERCLVLRYEDVVADPNATRAQLQRFLAPSQAMISTASPRQTSGQQLFMPWETWKETAIGPVVRDRIDAWRGELPAKAASNVAAICREMMAAFGYPIDPNTAASSTRSSVWSIGPADQWRRLHFRVARARLLHGIDSTRL